MKRLLIVLLFVNSPIIAQVIETTAVQETNKQKTNTTITSPYTSVYTRLSGISYLSQNNIFPSNTQGLSITGLELTIGRKIFFYYQIGYFKSFSHQLEPLGWGQGVVISVGAGGHLIDTRSKEVGIGSLLSVKGGLGAMFLFETTPNTKLPNTPFGLDLMLDYSYLFHKNVGVKIGLNISVYSASLMSRNTSFDVNTQNGLAIIYGLTTGFIF